MFTGGVEIDGILPKDIRAFTLRPYEIENLPPRSFGGQVFSLTAAAEAMSDKASDKMSDRTPDKSFLDSPVKSGNDEYVALDDVSRGVLLVEKFLKKSEYSEIKPSIRVGPHGGFKGPET